MKPAKKKRDDKMKDLTLNSIKINNEEKQLKVENGVLKLETKIGFLKVTSTNKYAKSVTFEHDGKEISVKFEGDVELLNALCNCYNSDKKRSLVAFESADEHFKAFRTKEVGDCFYVNDMLCAYKYEG